MMLRKGTVADRATVGRELKAIVWPEEGAAADAVRRVTILPPRDGQALISIDVPAPHDIALARTYNLTPLCMGFPNKFKITAQQTIYMMALGGTEEGEGLIQAGLIIEYLTDPNEGLG